MNQETFRLSTELLANMYGFEPNQQLVVILWNYLKDIPEDRYPKVQEWIIKTFIPTAQCPYPLIPHFRYAAKLSTIPDGVIDNVDLREIRNDLGIM